MTKEFLKQYRKLNQEIAMQQKIIESLYRKLESLPVYMGKVQASAKQFPYIRKTVPVLMSDPATTEHLEKMIALKEDRAQKNLELREEIEGYISSIDDTVDRQIFELIYIEGLTHKQAAARLGLERSAITHRIQRRLRENCCT